MSAQPLPLNQILNVAVVVSPTAAPGPSFNQALIVGSSTVIPSVGENSRLRLYYSIAAMIADGFLTSSPEYLAATLYFGQTPQPTYLWIGRQDLTAIAAATVGSSGGTNYAVGDILTVVQGGASAGQVKVATIGGSGAVTSVTLIQGSQGTGYSVASGLATTTGGFGSGATVNITAIGETPLQAMVACRVAQPNWYIGMFVGTATDADHLAIAGFIEAAAPNSQYFVTTQESGVVNGAIETVSVTAGGTGYVVGDQVTVVQSGASLGMVQVTTVSTGVVTGLAIITNHQGTGYSPSAGLATTNTNGHGTGLTVDVLTIGTTPGLLATLQAENYRRTFAQYSTTQGGVFPNNVYASAAPMGLAMGLNTGAAGSYFDLMFKAIAGVAPEPLTQSQVNAICGPVDRSQTGLNGNVVLLYANGDAWIQPSIMVGGTWFDEVLQLDMLAADMQNSGVNLLTSVPSLPITDAGVLQMKNALAGACLRSRARGFIAPSGVWEGQAVGSGGAAIAPGDALPSGYYLYAPPVSTLSSGQRSARILPPITALVIEAESGHSLSVTVNVQQ